MASKASCSICTTTSPFYSYIHICGDFCSSSVTNFVWYSPNIWFCYNSTILLDLSPSQSFAASKCDPNALILPSCLLSKIDVLSTRTDNSKMPGIVTFTIPRPATLQSLKTVVNNIFCHFRQKLMYSLGNDTCRSSRKSARMEESIATDKLDEFGNPDKYQKCTTTHAPKCPKVIQPKSTNTENYSATPLLLLSDCFYMLDLPRYDCNFAVYRTSPVAAVSVTVPDPLSNYSLMVRVRVSYTRHPPYTRRPPGTADSPTRSEEPFATELLTQCHAHVDLKGQKKRGKISVFSSLVGPPEFVRLLCQCHDAYSIP